MILKLVVTSTENNLYNGIKALLSDVLRDHDILQMDTHPDGLGVLLASLSPSCGSLVPSQQVLDFLDDCCVRFIKGSIKYFDDLDALRLRKTRTDSSHGPFSPLLMAIVEQWPFKGGSAQKGNPAEPLAQWLSKLLYLCKLVGEDDVLLDSLVSSADSGYQQVLKDSFLWKMGKEKAKEALKMATGADFSGSETSVTSPIPQEQPKKNTKEEVIDLELPPQEDSKHGGLHRWRKKDIDESIDDGDIGELLLCLCSQHAEIRLQAVSNIRRLLAKIEVRQLLATLYKRY
jgi:nucleolar pre-ribosomal-associated protein 1